MRYGTEKLNAKPGMFASLVDVVVESLVSALVVNQILDSLSSKRQFKCNQLQADYYPVLLKKQL